MTTGLLVFLLLFSSASTFAASAAPSCEAVYAELLARLKTDYTVVKNPKLPKEVVFDLRKKDPEELFGIFRQVYESGFDRKDWIDRIHQIGKGKLPDAQGYQDLKLFRARLKQLRFAYMAFDVKHEYPKHLNRLAVSLGHLQDAVKLKNLDEAEKTARRVENLLSMDEVKSVEKEVQDFKPATHSSMLKWEKKEIESLLSLFSHPEVSAEKFHDGRKAIARQNAIFFILSIARPSHELNSISDYLSAISGKMGLIHDKLIEGDLAGKIDYAKEQATIPKEISDAVLTYAKRVVTVSRP